MNQGGYGKIKYGKTWIFSYLTVPVSDENERCCVLILLRNYNYNVNSVVLLYTDSHDPIFQTYLSYK